MERIRMIPIYTTNGDAEAFLSYPYLFNRNGEWIGFVTPQREVYSVIGNYVGTLTNDPRIVSKRETSTLKPRLNPPPKPKQAYPPATIPLAPMMAELNYSIIDVLLDAPERLHTLDSSEQRQDMD
ncbi:MAG: 4-fold beta flower protein [Anaerolineales bacterium]